MNRLWVRLTLAFTIVVLVVVGAIALLANAAVDREFRSFVALGEATIENSGLTDQLIAYYEQHGSWDGIESLFTPGGPGDGSRAGPPRGPGRLRLPLLLADAGGRIVYDNRGHRVSAQLSAAERDAAIALDSQGTVVGYVAIAPGPVDQLLPDERTFVNQVQRSLLLAALLAGGVGMALGLALSRSLAHPLNRLAAAARAIAAKDFSQRVQPGRTTEVAEVAHAFNEMAASLEKAETLRRNLVADVAHELRTPLSVLQGNLTALIDGVYPLQMREVAKLYDETRLLSRLVDDLRELAQAEAGQLNLNLQSVDVAHLVQSTIGAFAAAAQDKQLQLITDLPSSLPLVCADAERLAQVMRNLLSNALRHTPSGGVIRVAAACSPGGVEVSVLDSGEGIAPDDLSHVFDRFWRGDKSRARETGGSGLGLAIARRLIEAQGGQIGAESKSGQGSRFWFRLPAV